ncbi:MAG TPA: maleylacetoacetate isomerase [Stellaceae bacterium]|jgi:maleylacetoacetate isomerase|nr:maleylacetoacetate isomerase [Stellaceae bacterium]
MKLYGYFRSSAAFRVRIALNLKGLDYEQAFIHLRKGDQRSAAYLGLNPQGLVPALVLEDGAVLTQSLSIIDYLEETRPNPALLPSDPVGRARVRSLAEAIACDIHPIDNLRVLQYLSRQFGHKEPDIETWFNHWIALGFEGIEKTLASDGKAGKFCHGDTPGLADICLVPQVFNARRYPSFDLKPYPSIMRIFDNCMKLEAFDRAVPEKQPDAE